MSGESGGVLHCVCTWECTSAGRGLGLPWVLCLSVFFCYETPGLDLGDECGDRCSRQVTLASLGLDKLLRKEVDAVLKAGKLEWRGICQGLSPH